MELTREMRREYVQHFKSCQVMANRTKEVDLIVKKIEDNKGRYEAVTKLTGVPWFVIAVIHNMESGLSFEKHLANGDPLTARTKQVPKGLPKEGNPPFSFEEAAVAALKHEGFDKISSWSLAEILFCLERFNGLGYRTKNIPTPYLWAASNHYQKGFFTGDHKFDPNAQSKQCGSAVILRRLLELGAISIDIKDEDLGYRYAPSESIPEVLELQKALNTLPSIFLRVDGQAGQKTSDAFQKATGRFLPGDPRIKP